MTKIEWATHTSNWLAGCTKVSPACTHCYAETMSARLATMPHAPPRYRDGVVEGRRWTGRISYDRDALHAAFRDLLGCRQPKRVFVNSMSDTFHADAPPESLEDLADAIKDWSDIVRKATAPVPAHVIMLLTKRPDRLLSWQREHFPDGLPSWVWAGCTVEDQRRADERVPLLLQVETKGVRFLSVEPLLGLVDLVPYLDKPAGCCAVCGFRPVEGVAGFLDIHGPREPCPRCKATAWGANVGWVIVGCESGPRRRETSVEWVRAIRDDCARAGVPFFLKQLFVNGQKVGLPELDGVAHAAVPGPRWLGPVTLRAVTP